MLTDVIKAFKPPRVCRSVISFDLGRHRAVLGEEEPRAGSCRDFQDQVSHREERREM